MVSTQEQKWTFFETGKWIRRDKDEWGMLERELQSDSAEKKQPPAERKRLGTNVVRNKLFSV
jgi:hypothetical protein